MRSHKSKILNHHNSKTSKNSPLLAIWFRILKQVDQKKVHKVRLKVSSLREIEKPSFSVDAKSYHRNNNNNNNKVNRKQIQSPQQRKQDVVEIDNKDTPSVSSTTTTTINKDNEGHVNNNNNNQILIIPTIKDIKKMKPPQLRKFLKSRNINTQGNKKELIKRCLEIIKDI